MLGLVMAVAETRAGGARLRRTAVALAIAMVLGSVLPRSAHAAGAPDSSVSTVMPTSTADGGIFPFGDAQGFGSTGDVVLASPIVGIAARAPGSA